MRLISTPVLAALMPLSGLAWSAGEPAIAQDADPGCVIMRGDRESAAARRSPLDSVSVRLDGELVKVCYGRPSARGREIFGGPESLVPLGQLWRTGANEPTMLHTTGPLSVAGVSVEPGTYSLYTVPGESSWQIIVNRSTSQWGHESTYTEEVKAQEVGRATVEATKLDEPVEQFTIRSESADGERHLILEWERTRVRVPLSKRM